MAIIFRLDIVTNRIFSGQNGVAQGGHYIRSALLYMYIFFTGFKHPISLKSSNLEGILYYCKSIRNTKENPRVVLSMESESVNAP